jgi:hypothetical protein
MKLRRFAPVCAMLLLAATSGYAQNTPAPPAAPLDTSLFGKLSGVFKEPLHPVINGVVSGGGLGAGVAYDFPSRGRWETTTGALVTIRRYWSAELGTVYRGDRVQFAGYARLRDLPELPFFGPGMDTAVADHTNFRLLDPVIGAVGSVRPRPWMAVGGRVEALWPDVGRGHAKGVPTIAARFDEGEAPGLREQPRFGRYQGFVEFQAPASIGHARNQGGRYRFAYGMFDDRQFGRFTFGRLDLEAQHKFALFGPHRRLTLHTWVVTTDVEAGNEVPFFLQPTLGGSGQLHSVSEDLIGSDGSRGTLRGFRNFRFRDRNLLLLQAEYRVPVWGPFDASVFADAGKVTSRRADLGLAGLKHDFGFSVSVMKGSGTMARTDIGFGSVEGKKLSVSFGVGADFLP